MVNLNRYPKTIQDVNDHIALVMPSLTGVKIARGKGYFYIYSEDREMAEDIAKFYSTSIYVSRLNNLNLRQWMDRVSILFTERNFYKTNG